MVLRPRILPWLPKVSARARTKKEESLLKVCQLLLLYFRVMKKVWWIRFVLLFLFARLSVMFQRRSRLAKPKGPGHLRVRRACAFVGCAKYKMMAFSFFFSLSQLSVFGHFPSLMNVKEDSRETLSTRHDASVPCMSTVVGKLECDPSEPLSNHWCSPEYYVNQEYSCNY